MKHISGPWEMVTARHQLKTGYWIKGPEYIVLLDTAYYENEVDAKLMAAAPELLEACKALLNEQNGAPLLTREKQYNEAVEKAVQAIAKATGEGERE